MTKSKLLYKTKLFLLFLYLSIYLMLGANSDTIIYSEVVLVLLISVELIEKIIYKEKILTNRPIISIFLFASWGLITSLWAINPDISLSHTKTMFLLAIFIFLSYSSFVNDKDSYKDIVEVIALSGVCFCIYNILYYGIDNYFKTILLGGRIGSEIDNLNAIGITSAIIFLFVFFIGKNCNKIYYILLPLPLIVTIGSGSRTALIMIFLSLILLLYFDFDKKNKFAIIKKVLIFLFILLLIYIVVDVLDFEFIKARFDTMFHFFSGSGHVDRSTRLRMEFIKKGFEAFLNNPLRGIGLLNSGYITTTIERDYFTYLHNNYIELLATTGIIGFLLYYYSYYYIMKKYFTNRKFNNKYLKLCFIVSIILLIGDYGTVSYYSKTTYVYLLFIFLTISSFNRGEENHENNEIPKETF